MYFMMTVRAQTLTANQLVQENDFLLLEHKYYYLLLQSENLPVMGKKKWNSISKTDFILTNKKNFVVYQLCFLEKHWTEMYLKKTPRIKTLITVPIMCYSGTFWWALKLSFHSFTLGQEHCLLKCHPSTSLTNLKGNRQLETKFC